MKIKIEACGGKGIYDPDSDKWSKGGKKPVAQIFIEGVATEYILWRNYDENKYEIKDDRDGFV